MTNIPHAISEQEWDEIIKVPEVREDWGLDENTTGKDFSEQVYGARFDYVSGGPGYSGDVFVLYGDALQTPVTLYRQGEDKHLVVMED